jgi:hypothetical protein
MDWPIVGMTLFFFLLSGASLWRHRSVCLFLQSDFWGLVAFLTSCCVDVGENRTILCYHSLQLKAFTSLRAVWLCSQIRQLAIHESQISDFSRLALGGWDHCLTWPVSYLPGHNPNESVLASRLTLIVHFPPHFEKGSWGWHRCLVGELRIRTRAERNRSCVNNLPPIARFFPFISRRSQLLKLLLGTCEFLRGIAVATSS